jgi:hypothetical protein
VEDLALEVLQSLDRRHRGHVQRTRGHDEVTAVDGVAGLGADGPAPGAVIEVRLADLLPEADEGAQAVLVRHIQDVVVDLAPVGVAVRPVRLGGEGEGIQVGLHVAGRPRIGIEVPGAADVLALLQDDKVIDARLAQLDRLAQATEAGAQDGDFHVLGLGLDGSLARHVRNPAFRY